MSRKSYKFIHKMQNLTAKISVLLNFESKIIVLVRSNTILHQKPKRPQVKHQKNI